MLPTLPDAGIFPSRVTLELTNRCNLRCTFCPRQYMEKERGFMDLELACNLIDQMAEHSPVAVVPFFRGESLLHPHWFTIFEYIQKTNVGPIQFTTNASLLTQRNSELILSLDLPFISFSLDTMDPVLYGESRRGADLEQTTDNVLNFLAIRDRLGAKTEVQVSAVETRAHREGMSKFVAFWRDKVDRVRVYTEHSSDGQPGSIREKLPVFPERLPCHKPFTDMVIYWNGQVASCNHDWTRLVSGKPLGDVTSHGIAHVWQGNAYEEFRQAHSAGLLDEMTPCGGCDHWKMFYMKAGYLGRTYTG